jgi:sentrin-specific protease 7
VYPFNGKKAVNLTNKDISRLDDKRFLNDVLMDAYSKILQDEHQREEIHTFSSLFFTRLTQSDKGSTDENSRAIYYEQVKKWTKNINLFEKEYIIIPIEQGKHWFLLIITSPGYCVGQIPEDDDDDVKR